MVIVRLEDECKSPMIHVPEKGLVTVVGSQVSREVMIAVEYLLQSILLYACHYQ